MLKRIRLELARTKQFPNGSHAHGYEFVAPLNAEGRLDVDAWRKNPLVCTVHRFWAGEGDQTGQLIRTRGGRWAFSYEEGDADNEPIHRLEEEAFKEGEYISIREANGDFHPFVVAQVRPAPGLS